MASTWAGMAVGAAPAITSAAAGLHQELSTETVEIKAPYRASTAVTAHCGAFSADGLCRSKQQAKNTASAVEMQVIAHDEIWTALQTSNARA